MEEKMIDIICETINSNRDCIKPGVKLDDIPEWDSLMFLMMLSRFKEELDIDIPIDKAIEISTVDELLAFVEG